MVSGCLSFRRSPNEGIARKVSVTLDDLGFFTLVELRLSFLAFDGVSWACERWLVLHIIFVLPIMS